MIKTLYKLLTISLLLVTPLLVQADDDHETAKRLKDAGDILSLEIILKNVREVQQGKILEAELESKNGNLLYEIELLTPEGKVLELIFDAHTGQHLSTEHED